MRSNNSNSDYTHPKTGVETVLSNLASRHYLMSRAYSNSVKFLEGKDSLLSTFLNELAEDHIRWENELENYLVDLAGSPHTPSKQDLSLFSGSMDELHSAVKAQNHPQLYQLVLAANHELTEFYSKSLANSNLNENVISMIKQQGEELLEQQRKLERLKSVPL